MKMVELGEVATIDRESIVASGIRSGTKYLGLENVYSDGSSVPVDVDEGELLSNKFVFGPKHLLYGKLRPYLNKITLPDFEGICSTDIIPILPDANKLNKRYLYYYLRTPWMIETAVKACSGANLPRVDPKLLAKFKIPLPPLPTQRRIAAVLDKAQALVANDRRTLAVYDQLAKSLFLELFGDPVRNERGWELVTLRTCYKADNATRCGPFGSALKKAEYVEEGIPVWTMDNIVGHSFDPGPCLYLTPEKYADLTHYAVKDGDIIISRAGTVGKMCVLNSSHEHSIISTNLIKLSLDPKKLLPEVFVRLMTYFRGRVGNLRTGSDGAFTHMNTQVLDNLLIALPPLTVQKKYLSLIAELEKQRQNALTSLHRSESLFGSLLGGAFRGELGG